MRKAISILAPTLVTATGPLADFNFGGAFGFADFVKNSLNTAGTNPTLALKLQHADPAVVGQSQVTAGATDNKIFSASTTNNKLAASFTQSGAKSVSSVFLRLKKIGTIAAGKKVTVGIYADSSGPTGSALASCVLDIDTQITTTYDSIEAVFATPADLADATVYWIVVSVDYTASSSNCVQWRSLTVASGGNQATFNNTAWTLVSTESFEFVQMQRTYTDITGGGYTTHSTALTGDRQTKYLDATGVVKKHVRPYATIGGTSNPAFAVSVDAIVKLHIN